MAEIKNINNAGQGVVRRISTRIDEIDWLYGYSKYPDKPISKENSCWGLPERKISLWAGESGVGKTRMAIEIARYIARSERFKVLYFQNEMDLASFAGKVKSDNIPVPSDYFIISNASTLSDQIDHIRQGDCRIVIVDSINMLEEFGWGSDSSIKKIIDAYREVQKDINSHIILLSQLTKKGDPRGSTTLSHLVDIVFELKKEERGSAFCLRVGNKHRYGRVGIQFSSCWSHTETGVRCYNQRNHRLDEIWCKSHGVSMMLGDIPVKKVNGRFCRLNDREVTPKKFLLRSFLNNLKRY